MKILYATQATGNGHLSRAKELIPLFRENAEVDILVSGTASQILLPWKIDYHLHGLSFIFGQKGGINLQKSLTGFKPGTLIRDIFNFPFQKYDAIINDFEPVSAWAAKRKSIPIFALSHQYSFSSALVPRPHRKNHLAEFIINKYAPVKLGIGFHFQAYDHFITTPIIRQYVRQQTIVFNNHLCVYMPAWNDQLLVHHFNKFPQFDFHLFSRTSKQDTWKGNVWIRPIHDLDFVQSMATSNGIITAGGFETPAEALFLGKKLLSIPMMNQYEQLCNAIALKKMGVTVLAEVNDNFPNRLGAWLDYSTPLNVTFPDNSKHIVQQILSRISQSQICDFKPQKNKLETGIYLSNS